MAQNAASGHYLFWHIAKNSEKKLPKSKIRRPVPRPARRDKLEKERLRAEKCQITNTPRGWFTPASTPTR
jgi:hypothetical protein